MCLIIHRELNDHGVGSNVPNNVIEYNRSFNKDGFGIAWRTKDGVKSEKFAPTDFETFRELLKAVDVDPTIEYVAHFRTATHGAPCKDFSHPFTYSDPLIGDDVHVFHNGVIGIPTAKGANDTKTFVDDVLTELPSRWWEKWHFRYLVEESIGYSRLLVMTDDETQRFNQDQWYEIGGIWYSTWPLSEASRPKPQGQYSWNGNSFSRGWSEDYEAVDAIAWADNRAVEQRYAAALVEDEMEMDIEDSLLPVLPQNAASFMHDGHQVTPLIPIEEDADGDAYGQCVCDDCESIGEFFVMDGKRYCELQHVAAITPEPEDGPILAVVPVKSTALALVS